MNPVDQILPSQGVKPSAVAKRLGITARQVCNLIDKGELKAVHVGSGKNWVTTWEWVAAHLKRQNPSLRRY